MTLDEDAWIIAKGMSNFSAFVRRATKATEEGGLELVEPTQLSSARMISMLLMREQKEHGFDTQVGADLLFLHAHFKNIKQH